MKRRAAIVVLALLPFLGSLSASPAGAGAALRIGAVFPLHGPLSALANQQYRGVAIAAALVNADGGVDGRSIDLDTRELDDPANATSAVASLQRDGVPVVIGAYNSALSVPASAATSAAGLAYWEAGAVADQITGTGSPRVFRVGASGDNLGDSSALFTATELVPRLHTSAAATRVAVVFEDDAYGSSVGDAAAARAHELGLNVVGVTRYNAYNPNWDGVFSVLRSERPNVIIIASYILDGVAFRRQMLARNFHTGALIGTTMAECGPDYGAMLGKDAIGVFSSDRPGGSFNPSVLTPETASAYGRFAALWEEQTGTAPTEEGISGFSAGWALFHDVLPRAQTLTSDGIANAARATVLPSGSLPNGAGLHFAASGPREGQNLDAASVIWQWQAAGRTTQLWPSGTWSGGNVVEGNAQDGAAPTAAARTLAVHGGTNNVVVWPRAYATGSITDVPLTQ